MDHFLQHVARPYSLIDCPRNKRNMCPTRQKAAQKAVSSQKKNAQIGVVSSVLCHLGHVAFLRRKSFGRWQPRSRQNPNGVFISHGFRFRYGLLVSRLLTYIDSISLRRAPKWGSYIQLLSPLQMKRRAKTENDVLINLSLITWGYRTSHNFIRLTCDKLLKLLA